MGYQSPSSVGRNHGRAEQKHHSFLPHPLLYPAWRFILSLSLKAGLGDRVDLASKARFSWSGSDTLGHGLMEKFF